MILAVASGKGGTGKTTVAANLAASVDDISFADCDVEEPNAHLFLKPEISSKEESFVMVPEVDYDKCIFCGECGNICEYGAITVFPRTKNIKKGSLIIYHNLCHSCGACSALCKEEALYEKKRINGLIEQGRSGSIDFISGRLNAGEAMSPPLIRAVKSKINTDKDVVLDCPPGTSCPVVTSVNNADYIVLVTEPTPFGLHDLKLAAELAEKMGIICGVVLNKSGPEDYIIENYCGLKNIEVLMKIPFKKEYAVLVSEGKLLVDSFPGLKGEFREAFKKIKAAGSKRKAGAK